MKCTFHTLVAGLFLSFIYGCIPAYAQTEQWVKHAGLPAGGDVKYMDTDNAGTVYALMQNTTTAGSAIFYSEDNGLNWQEMPEDILYSNPTYIEVDKISGTLYAGTLSRGLHWTSDKGSTWTRNPFYTVSVSGTNAFINQVAKKSGTGILVCNEPGVFTASLIYKSGNGGLTWTEHTAPFGTANDMLFKQDGSLIAGTEHGLFTSADNGETWSATNIGIADLRVTCLAEKSSSGQLYAGTDFNTTEQDTTQSGVYTSSDGGMTWQRIDNGLPDTRINAIAIDQASGRITIATPSGIYLSANNGITWTSSGNGLASLQTNAVIHTTGGLFSGSGQSGISWYATAQSQWVERNNGIKVNSLQKMVVMDNGNIHMLDMSRGTYRHNTAGWLQQINGLPASIGSGMAKGNAGSLYASFVRQNDPLYAGGIYRSANNGNTWSLFSANMPLPAGERFTSYPELKVTQGGKVYAIVKHNTLVNDEFNEFSELMVTENNGSSWTQLYMGAQEVDLASNGHIYVKAPNPVTFETEFLQSADNGATFTKIDFNISFMAPFASENLSLHIDRNDSLYLTDQNMIYKRNGVNNWVLLPNGGWPAGPAEFSKVNLAIDPGNRIYAVVPSYGIYYTENDGTDWTDISASIPAYESYLVMFTQLDFDSDNTPFTFAVTAPDSLRGIYKFTDEVTGIKPASRQEAKEQLVLFPNPSQDQVYLTYIADKQEQAIVKVYDIAGQCVQTGSCSLVAGSNRKVININQHAPGMYIVKLIMKDKTKTAKLVKR
jgi:hypothetical protein